MQSDIKPIEIIPSFRNIPFRTPLKFGKAVITSNILFTVKAIVENKEGERAEGYGDILLSAGWAYPNKDISFKEREDLMVELAKRFCKIVNDYDNYVHPIKIYLEAKKVMREITDSIGKALNIPGEIPLLTTLVPFSSIDAALHDAFGKVNKIDSYKGYGKEFMENDLSDILGENFKGKYIEDYLSESYAAEIPVFHLVGALDKLTKSEKNDEDPKDGLPVSLDEWIEKEGVFCFKVKLTTESVDVDVDRIINVTKVAKETLNKLGQDKIYTSVDSNELCVDSNELCPNPQYVVDMLKKLKERDKFAFDSLLYVEQPTERELSSHNYDMKEVSKIKPVLADEGITDLDKLDLAIKLNWSGVAMKTCKGHSSALLYLAKAKEAGLTYSVQDLTNPCFSLIHSIGFAGRISPIMGVESNSRQYIPFASDKQAKVHPGMFKIKGGVADLSTVGGYGLGYNKKAHGSKLKAER
jgi:L-alanine-DL-glutamate epimerase-like enolase superfamily enzyme